jgi:hypothetical protein
MARNAMINIPANTWIELTNSDVTAAAFSVEGGYPVWISLTSGASPTDFEGARRFNPNVISPASLLVADLWPGVASGDRLWAHSMIPSAVAISHV